MSSTPQHKSPISNVLCQAVTSAHWLIPTPASRYWKMISRTNVILIVFILGPRYRQQLTNLHRIYWKSVRSVQGIILEASWLTESWVLSCNHQRRQFDTSTAIIRTLSHIPAPKVCTVVYRCNVQYSGGDGELSFTIRHQAPVTTWPRRQPTTLSWARGSGTHSSHHTLMPASALLQACLCRHVCSVGKVLRYEEI